MRQEDIVRKIVKIRSKIEASKKRLSETQGAIKAMKQQMKQEYGVSSMADAKEKVESMEHKLDELRTELEEELENIDV